MTLRMLTLVMILCCMGAAPCGTGPPIGTWTYGLQEPKPSFSIAQRGNVLSVNEAFGDRMFTVFRSTYEADSLRLLTSDRHASCCGEYWNSTIRRNNDGTYDVEAQTNLTSTDVLTESRPHYQSYGRLIVAGTLLLTPWVYAKTHTQYIQTVTFDPLSIRDVAITETPAMPYPNGVPKADHAIKLTAFGQPPNIVWYDPCTFVVDAYGRSADHAWVRTSLIQSLTPKTP